MGKPFRRAPHELSPPILTPMMLTELYHQLDVKLSLSMHLHGTNVSTESTENVHTSDEPPMQAGTNKSTPTSTTSTGRSAHITSSYVLFAIIICNLANLDEAMKSLASIAGVYFVSVAAIVAAFYGKEAYTKGKASKE